MSSNHTETTHEPSELQCAVCLHPFRDPRLLPCHHVFCLACLTATITSTTKTNTPNHTKTNTTTITGSQAPESATEPPSKRAASSLPLPSSQLQGQLQLGTQMAPLVGYPPMDLMDPSQLFVARNANQNTNTQTTSSADMTDFYQMLMANSNPMSPHNTRKRTHGDPSNPGSHSNPQKDDASGLKEEEGQFPCPVCRQVAIIPEGGLSKFPVFEMAMGKDENESLADGVIVSGINKDLADPNKCVSEDCANEAVFFCKGGCGSLCADCASFHRKLKATRSHELLQIKEIDTLRNTINGIAYCKNHPGFMIEFYCHTCSHSPLLCLRCIPFGHNNHKYTDLQTGLAHVKSAMTENIEETQSLVEKLNSTLTELVSQNEKVEDSAEEAISAIKDIVRKYVDVLKEIETEIIDEVSQKKSEITESIRGEMTTAKFLTANLQHGRSKAQTLIDRATPMQVLRHGPLLSCLLDTYIQRAERLQLAEPNVISFLPYTSITIRRDDDRNKAKTSLGRVQVHGDIRNRQTHNRKYTDIHEMKKKAGRRGSGRVEFDHAWGIAANPRTGNLYVADQFNHRIQILSADLDYVGEFGRRGNEAGMFNNPISVCVDPSGSCVVVVDNGNHRLQVFTAEGKHIRTIGSDGSLELQFRNPLNVAMAYNGVMFVTDTRTERVQMVTEDGKFLRFVGQRGCGEGEVGGAEGITITQEDEVCVLARGGTQIQVFDVLGDFKRAIPIDPVEGRCSLLAGPENTLWVSDSDNHRVVVYTASGERVRTIGTGMQGQNDGEFSNQMGIAFGPKGEFYVCDYGNNRIQVF